MRNSHLLLTALVLLSCSTSDKSNPGTEADFINAAKHFHNLYITAGDCSERNSLIDKDIIFFENRKPFTYQNILDYCSYIKPKNPFHIYSEQYLIRPDIGFDYVDQYFLNSDQDTIREISSRVWELKSDKWVVTYMQVSR
jgi:hypothetical protein